MVVSLLAGFIVVICYIHYHVSALPNLDDCPYQEPDQWPKVTVVVPACNEESAIGPAMLSLLNQNYSPLEIIAINDRSTDSTGEILDDLAMKFPQLTVIHLTELPPGWLGKVHAMKRGTEKATGEFLIFTDADVHFSSDCLSKVMGWVHSQSLDHVTLGPLIRTDTLPLDVMVSCFTLLLFAHTRVARIVAGKSDSYLGIGAFNLVRRSVFEQTREWSWLRLEITDDLGLAHIMREKSTRSGIAMAPDHVSLTWYASISEMTAGLQKSVYPKMGRFQPLRAFLMAVACLVVPLALVWGFVTPYWWLSLLVILIAGTSALTLPWIGRSRLTMALAPLAVPVLSYVLMSSMVGILVKKGVVWRGTHYGTDDLKKGQRVRL